MQRNVYHYLIQLLLITLILITIGWKLFFNTIGKILMPTLIDKLASIWLLIYDLDVVSSVLSICVVVLQSDRNEHISACVKLLLSSCVCWVALSHQP